MPTLHDERSLNLFSTYKYTIFYIDLSTCVQPATYTKEKVITARIGCVKCVLCVYIICVILHTHPQHGTCTKKAYYFPLILKFSSLIASGRRIKCSTVLKFHKWKNILPLQYKLHCSFFTQIHFLVEAIKL